MADVNMQVQELYVAYFNRPADVTGLKYWSDVLAADPNGYQTVARNFSYSLEYWMAFYDKDNRQIVDTVYQHLFGRAAETAGIDYWAGLLDQKALTVANVVTEVAHGAQGKDKTVIDGKVAVAAAFTRHLDLPLEQQLYSGTFANKIAADYLATIVDAGTAASALLPANIDATIAKLGSQILTPHAESAQVVGVPPAHA